MMNLTSLLRASAPPREIKKGRFTRRRGDAEVRRFNLMLSLANGGAA